MGTAVMGLWSGYRCQVIEDIKSCYPEVKASKSVKRLRSYGHFKITIKNDLECINLPLKNPTIFWGFSPRKLLDFLMANLCILDHF